LLSKTWRPQDQKCWTTALDSIICCLRMNGFRNELEEIKLGHNMFVILKKKWQILPFTSVPFMLCEIIGCTCAETFLVLHKLRILPLSRFAISYFFPSRQKFIRVRSLNFVRQGQRKTIGFLIKIVAICSISKNIVFIFSQQ